MPQPPVAGTHVQGHYTSSIDTLWESWSPGSMCSAVCQLLCDAGLWPPPHSHCPDSLQKESMPTAQPSPRGEDSMKDFL